MNVVTLINRLADQDIRLWLQDGNLRYSAPDGAMNPDIINQLRAAKPEIIRFLQQSESGPNIQLPLADRNAPLAISHAQQRLWFIHRLDPANTAYHIHVALHIHGKLEPEYLRQACNEIIRRHEILRTSYVQQEGRVYQLIRPAFDYPVKAELISAAELPHAIHHELHQAFALDGEVFRVRLWQMADTDFALSFTIHHIAADGWSLGIFVNELVQLYEAFSQGRSASLPVLPCQYADYAFWQSANDSQHQQQLQYWRRQLDGVANLSLPYDTPPSTYSGNEGAGVQVILEKATLEKLQQLNKAQGSTLFMSLLAALSVLLQRYSQQDDFCIGTPIAGRSISQLEPLIGCFLNVLAIRCQPRPEFTFSEYLQTIKSTCSEAFANQDVPFERIVQELVQERDLAISPLFQVMLSVQNAPLAAISKIADLDITPYTETEAAAQFDLKLTASEEDNRLVLLFEYRKTLFRAATITQLAENFLTLLDHLASTPSLPLHRIPLLTAARQQALLGLQAGACNDTASAWPEQDSVIHLFQRQVEQTPDAFAVSSPAGRLTYAQFNERVNRLAHYLLEEQQLPKQARIVICQKADTDFLVAIYATLKAGVCYIPVDPGYPDERIRQIISDAGATLVLTDRIQQQRLQLDSTHCLCMAELAPALMHYSSANPTLAIKPDDAIYCIFTSGSTGKPKGVEVKHRGESNLIHWYIREFGFDHRDKCLVISAAGFDLTQKNFFAPLCSGGEVVLHGLDFYEPQAIARLINEHRITVINCAPSAFYPLIQDNDHNLTQSLRIVLLGGEPIRKEIVHAWLGATQFRCELVNMYGPTECTDIASIYRIRSDSDLQRNSIPIGRPIANTQLHILDDYRQLLPAGAIGELYIGGAGLARGYVNNAALTADSFIDNPFVNVGHPSTQLYKTGDLVRYCNDGNIDYIGRTDQQIKIRGLRIEPGEIESRLQKIPGIRESLVIACKRPGTDNTVLLAYLVTDNNSVDNTAVRHQLLLELPQYMIPACFIALPAWPLGANGKIDRKALPQPDWNQLSQRPYAAPVTATQQTLAAIWSDVLGIEKIGIHDSFFELGGHSLSATQALSRAQESFAVEVPLRQIFENPTLEAIAGLIDTALLEKTVFSNNSQTDEDTETFLL